MTASPSFAGATAFTIAPIPRRAAACFGQRRAPAPVSAECQAPTVQTNATRKADERKRKPGTACVREDVQRRRDVVPAAEEGEGGRKRGKHQDAAGSEHESVP